MNLQVIDEPGLPQPRSHEHNQVLRLSRSRHQRLRIPHCQVVRPKPEPLEPFDFSLFQSVTKSTIT